MRMYVCMYVCMYVRMCIYIYIYTIESICMWGVRRRQAVRRKSVYIHRFVDIDTDMDVYT